MDRERDQYLAHFDKPAREVGSHAESASLSQEPARAAAPHLEHVIVQLDAVSTTMSVTVVGCDPWPPTRAATLAGVSPPPGIVLMRSRRLIARVEAEARFGDDDDVITAVRRSADG